MSAAALSPDDRAALEHIYAQAAGDLEHNVLPFWTRNTYDEESGGFITHLNRFGERTGVTDKYLVMQARMVWTLSAACRAGVGDEGLGTLAARGARFLADKLWDAEHGGFFFAVQRDGEPLDSRKLLYGHAFAIYAFAEHYLASGDEQSREWACRTFDTVRERMHRGNGYVEAFDREWRPIDRGVGGAGAATRTLNSLMHLMEGTTVLAQATGATAHREALRELTGLLLEHAIDPVSGAAYETFDLDWRPVAGADGKLHTSYGHNVEFAWLLLDTLDFLGLPREPHRAALLGLIDHCLAYGFDTERGGIAMFGPLTGHTLDATDLPERRLVKDWWEQAEALVAFAEAFAWTGDHRYLAALKKQWDWVWRHQIDHEGGDWYGAVDWTTGAPRGTDKGGAWKACYHNGRALLRLTRTIASLLGRAPAGGDTASAG